MIEFAQTSGNLTEASTGLYELFKGRNLILYPDADLRLAVSRSVALESSRGWRISKEKASHKIDIVVALAQACFAAVAQQASVSANWTYHEMLQQYELYRGGQRSAIIQPRAGMGRQQIIDAADDARNDAARLLRRFSTNKRFLPREEFFRVIGW